MRFCGCGYYVGLLSAAALHGAAHQQPMEFQVLTDKLGTKLYSGKIVINARRSRVVGRLPTIRIQTETGTMAVSTPETTALDLVRYPEAVGSWHNIATVLTERAERIDPVQLVATAELALLPNVQRPGYLLDAIEETQLATPLSDWATSKRTTVVPLRTDVPVVIRASDNRWKVIPNEDIESDL